MSDRRPRPATRSVHPPRALRPVGAAGERAHVAPLYQNASWELDDAAGNDAVAEGRGYFYARHGAPNADAVAAAMAGLEEGEAATCFSSGMAALTAIFSTFVGRGGTLVTVRGIYGGTVGLVEDLAVRYGYTLRWADAPSPEALAPLLEGASLVHLETLSNPLLRVADLDGVAKACRSHGVPLSVDATFTTPVLSRPLVRGASLVMHSATKYLGGHGDLCAGVVSGSRALVDRLSPVARLHGAVLDPFAAWLLQRGLRTLHLRVMRQVENARAIADALEELRARGVLTRVHYPGLVTHPDHALCEAQLDGPGAMVAFEVAGGRVAALRVYDRLKLIQRVASLGDVETMIMHPATTSHRGLSVEDRARDGITDGLLRLSVGIEDPADVIDDLRQALEGPADDPPDGLPDGGPRSA